jgi:hypothetical protein
MRDWEDFLGARLAADPDEAAAYLRLALTEEQDNPAEIQHVAAQVKAARGTLQGLGLTFDEMAQLLDAVTPAPLAQAA